jgi:hypothetical protein
MARADGRPARWAWAAAFSLALAAGNEPLAGLLAALVFSIAVAADREARRSLAEAWAEDAAALGASAFAGFLPAIVAIAHGRASGLWAAATRARGGESPLGALTSLVDDIGPVLAVMAVVGAVLSFLVERSRSLAAGLVAALAGGVLLAPLAGDDGRSAMLLTSVGAACLLAGVSMQAAVRAVAASGLPFSSASAAMVVILECAIPAGMADEALQLRRPGNDATLWGELAWDVLPPRSVVLVSSPRIEARALAARGQGALRDDLVIVPTFGSRRNLRNVLSRDAALLPLWRDIVINAAPGTASLSALATTRAVAMAYEPAWGKEMGRNLVPAGLFDLFEPEPRGSSDRRKSLDAFRASRIRLAAACDGDPALAEATAILLGARALQLSSSGDRELAARALDDLRAFAPSEAAHPSGN